jgi:predicted O-methyltransferase YrrM
MEQVLPHKSLRFFPIWNTYDSSHVIGFLNMVNFILERKKFVKNWLELGSFIGESTNLLLGYTNIEHIDCVDSSEYLISHFKKRHKKHIQENKCTIHHKTSHDFLTNIPQNYMDVVYIDGNHDYDFVKEDIELSFSKLQNDGFLCGHDYSPESNTFPGVIRAVDEFSQKHNSKPIRFIDSSWLMVKE